MSDIYKQAILEKITELEKAKKHHNPAQAAFAEATLAVLLEVVRVAETQAQAHAPAQAQSGGAQ